MMLANLLKTKPAPDSAVIAVRCKKYEDELRAANVEKADLLDAGKNVRLHGSDEDIAKHDAETASALVRLDGIVKNAEYWISVLTEERRIKLEAEKKTAIEEEKKSGYEEEKTQLAAFNKRAPEIARMMASLVAALGEERALRERIGKVNRNLPAGAEPLEMPLKAARYTPAPPPPRLGKVLKSRLKEPRGNRASLGGDGAYESYWADEEPPLFGGERADDPDPLFRTVTLPPFRKGGPFWRPE
jgi:hypothetical protein